jgi:endonuclease/exonuclease/phosphatase family metal-dependent hydrolase
VSGDFTVATYNIAKGLGWLGRKPRVTELRHALQSLDADVVLLQEVQDRNDRLAARRPEHPSGAQSDFLGGSGLPFIAYGANKHYPHGHHGNAVLSRWPITESANVDISQSVIERRGVLAASLIVQGVPIKVITTHFSLLARDRHIQALALVRLIRDTVPADMPLLIAGDFNDWRRQVDQVLRQELGVTEAFDHLQAKPARTFPSVLPLLRLDRIYVRGLSVLDAVVPGGKAWNLRSDHRPIVTRIGLQT